MFLIFGLFYKVTFSEIGQLWMGGASDYVKDRWNVMDFFMNSLYLATISTKICAYMKHMGLSEGFVSYNLKYLLCLPERSVILRESSRFSCSNLTEQI